MRFFPTEITGKGNGPQAKGGAPPPQRAHYPSVASAGKVSSSQ